METDVTGFPEIVAWIFAAVVTFYLRVWPAVKEVREEQKNPETRFGSKKWHAPALAFLGLLLLLSFFLIHSSRTP